MPARSLVAVTLTNWYTNAPDDKVLPALISLRAGPSPDEYTAQSTFAVPTDEPLSQNNFVTVKS
jgi:hypothetical protein